MNGYNEIETIERKAQKELNSQVSYICLMLQMQAELKEDDWKELLRLERRFREINH